MKTLVATLIVCLCAGISSALIDDGTDSLGAYFDDTGDLNCFAPTPLVPFDLYWILANPTDDNLGGFEFGWAFSPAIVPAPLILSTTLPPLSLNIGTDYNLIVGLGGGLVTTAATVLVSFNLMLLGPVDGQTYVTAGPATPASVPGHAVAHTFNNTGEMYLMDFATVDDITVTVNEAGWVVPGVAELSCPGPVATETATWSNVKTLFR